MAAVLAFKSSGWALLVGILMNLALSNMDFQKKKLGVPTTEELEAIDQEKSEELSQILHSLFSWEDFGERARKYTNEIENNYQNYGNH